MHELPDLKQPNDNLGDCAAAKATDVDATVDARGVDLTWTAPTGGIDSQLLERRNASESAWTQVGEELTARIDSASDGAVGLDAIYRYRIVSSSTACGLVASSEVEIATTPNAPTNVVAVPEGSTRITVTWTDINQNNAAYRVERSIASAPFAIMTSSLRAETTSYADDAATPGALHTYRVSAISVSGLTSAPGEASATTLPDVSNTFNADATSTTSIELSWATMGAGATGARIERSDGDGSNFVSIATGIATTDTTYTDSGLTAETHYFYQFILTNAGGESAPDSADTWTLPSAVGALSATTVSTTQIDLSWTNSNTADSGVRIERSLAGQDSFSAIGTAGTASTAFSDTSAAADAHYDYRVVPFNPGGDALPTVTDAWTLPDPVTGLAVTGASGTELTVTWSNSNGNATNYVFETLDSAGGSILSTQSIPASGSSSATSTGLSQDTEYFYAVTVQNPGGSSTRVETSGQTLSAGIANLGSNTVSPTSIDLTWDDVSASETGFRIERSPTGANTYAAVATVAADSTGYGDTGLTVDTGYDYRVYVINGAGESLTGSITVWTFPLTPSAVTATPASTTQIDLAWTDNSATETSYAVERSPAGANSWSTMDATIAADATAYSDSTAVADTQYDYRVSATNPGGSSGFGTASGWTLPAAVTGLAEAPVSNVAIDLTWVDPNANETGYEVSRRLFGETVWVPISGALATDTTSYGDTGLTESTRYEYQVSTTNPGGTSAAQTDAWTLPAAASEVAATTVSTTQIDISWTDNSAGETGYRVLRDSSEIAALGADSTTYSDAAAVAGVSYSYEIVVDGPGGAATSGAVSERASDNPVLNWQPSPALAANCQLTVPASTIFDTLKGAALSTASGSIAQVSGTVTATATGLTGTVDDMTLGTLATGWTVTDTLGGSTTVNRDLALQFAPGALTTTPNGVAGGSLGEDYSVGRQPWFTFVEPATVDCGSHCTGLRGSLASGVRHACVKSDGGGVECWGDGLGGELGDGGNAESATAVDVCISGAGSGCPRLGGVVMVTSGGHDTAPAAAHSCALLDTGKISCWGSGGAGQLGDGDSTDTSLPVEVCAVGAGAGCVGGAALDLVVDVAAGGQHTCAVTSTGAIMCWGLNTESQLGDATLLPRANPVTTGISFVAVAVAAGNAHNCALSAHGLGGDVECWGDNSGGQLGGGDITASEQPRTVCTTGSHGGGCADLTGVVSLALGVDHTCALTDSGTVACWGANDFGQLGNGTTVQASNPVTVCTSGIGDATGCGAGQALTNVEAISAGRGFTCALRTDGTAQNRTVQCWGANASGQLGDGTSTTPRSSPSPVCATGDTGTCVVQSGLIAIDAGWDHACALTETGGTTCWGTGANGRLGDAQTAANQLNPVAVQNTATTDLTGADRRMCGVLEVIAP